MVSADLALGEQFPVDHIGQMALEATKGLSPALALRPPALHTGATSGIDLGLNKRDGVNRPVQPSVAAAVEPMPLDVAQRSRIRGSTQLRRESSRDATGAVSRELSEIARSRLGQMRIH